MQELNTSVTERTETLQPPEMTTTPPRSKSHGWISALRSYLIFDPLIWLYTVVLGIISIPCSIFGNTEKILHSFARFWSKVIMKTILSAVLALSVLAGIAAAPASAADGNRARDVGQSSPL